MLESKNTFALYASGTASRIIHFFSNPTNLKNFPPNKVVYDGHSKKTIVQLTVIFDDKLILFDEADFTEQETKKINTTFSKFLHAILDKHDIHYLLCFGEKILKKDLIQEYPNRLINFHPSILPAYRGLSAIDQALRGNASFIGNTAHYIDESIDAGEIILQTAMNALDFESYEDVLELQLPMIKWVLLNVIKVAAKETAPSKELANRTKPFLISR